MNQLKKIKLAFIRQKYRPDGGAERFLARAIDALKKDIDITLFTRKWQKQDNIEVIECNPRKWSRISREDGFIKAVCKEVCKHNFDLVQSHERTPCCDIFRAGDGIHEELLKQTNKVTPAFQRAMRKISRFHNHRIKAEGKLFNSKQLKAIICNSQMVADEIKEYFPNAADKTRVIYSCIDFSEFNPELKQERARIRSELNIPESETVYLFVGSGFKRKGAAAAIAALARLEEGVLLIVGKDKNINKYKRLASDLQIADRVLFLGVKQDVKPYYGCADAFLFPTLYDPFPNVVIEAMASGLPIITSTKCGAAELIEQEKNGFVCDALDIESISKFMKKIQEPELQSKMTQEVLNTAKIFSTDAMIDNLTRLYSELLAAK